ncbi:hypothetical protein PTSG_05100 [Salpingoeca rosetta]|uniref:Uncharacterized protein n=1 Tax=Salpingoeca rosetta (strain ATCC 50818 / BSB-021) TaxID=946362 RepID=F2UAI8_SALR5|nr:uncharacterized protein PTSG_05100 [Salpingoeca rosetta]EGD73404.1 hypothetical protein PTSG_05100 [Salpingoeca rosetta]|eukprot:XP_004993686.1 hypothetical protein PTSG_05100 [Salpingoeca rosetta]
MTGTRRQEPTISEMISKYSEAMSAGLPNIFQRSPTLNIADALSVSAVTPHAAAPASNASPVSTCTGAESKRESLAFLSDAPLRRQRSRSTSSSRHTAVQEVDEEEDEDTSTTTTATTSASTLHGDIDALFAGVHVVGVRADSSVSPAQRRRRRSNSKGHAHTMMQRQQQYQQYQQQHARISNSSGSGSGSGLGVDGGVGLEKRSPIKRASPPARPKADVFSFDAKTVQNYHDKIRDRLTVRGYGAIVFFRELHRETNTDTIDANNNVDVTARSSSAVFVPQHNQAEHIARLKPQLAQSRTLSP